MLGCGRCNLIRKYWSAFSPVLQVWDGALYLSFFYYTIPFRHSGISLDAFQLLLLRQLLSASLHPSCRLRARQTIFPEPFPWHPARAEEPQLILFLLLLFCFQL